MRALTTIHVSPRTYLHASINGKTTTVSTPPDTFEASRTDKLQVSKKASDAETVKTALQEVKEGGREIVFKAGDGTHAVTPATEIDGDAEVVAEIDPFAP